MMFNNDPAKNSDSEAEQRHRVQRCNTVLSPSTARRPLRGQTPNVTQEALNPKPETLNPKPLSSRPEPTNSHTGSESLGARGVRRYKAWGLWFRLGCSPLILTALNRESHRGYYNPYCGLLAYGGASQGLGGISPHTDA